MLTVDKGGGRYYYYVYKYIIYLLDIFIRDN